MSGPGGVTVVIPVWDEYVRYLLEAVESVRRNAADAPVVIVDNASTVPIPEVERCELVRSERRLSAGAARNLGLNSVSTEFVVFLDADDLLLDGTLDDLHERIAGHAGLSVCGSLILDEETGERHRGPRRFVPALARLPRIFALADSVWSLLPIQGCAILRTDHVRHAGGYADADSGEDWVLAVSLLWRGRLSLSKRLGLLYRAPDADAGRGNRRPAELRASARRVRQRMRRDPGVPAWARVLLPGIAALQLSAIHAARPLFLAIRAALRWVRGG